LIIDEVKSVLVVDDEEDLREILRFELEDQGYNVLEAKGVDDAIATLAQNNIDIIVSPIRMPEKSGIELLKDIRGKNYCAPPLLFMSGFADISISQAFDLGSAGVFSKPIDMTGLLDKVEVQLQPAMEHWKKRSDWSEVDNHFKTLTFKNIEEAEENNNVLIGHGGVFIKCSPEQFPPLNSMTYFEISFSNPSTTIKGIGKCRWQRQLELNNNQPSGVGIEFIELADSSIVFLTKLMEKEMRKPYIPC